MIARIPPTRDATPGHAPQRQITPPHIDTAVLEALLDDRLPARQTADIERHLSDCESCRLRLDNVAGQHAWWDETRDALSDTALEGDRRDHAESDEQPDSSKQTVAPEPNAKHESPSDDASLAWVRPLMQPCSIGRLGRFGDHPIDGIIGQGGMGVVLRGRDRQLGRDLAIKVLSPHLAGVGAARARFLREARSAAAIIHPSVVPIYGIETQQPLPSIVMPCIAGGNLQQRIDGEGPLDIQEVLRIGLQIAEGLGAAHRVGVIHRDIKPANILMESGTGRALISDFGLARALDDGSMTLSGMIAGTPQYMSPEQARGETLDPRSDLFSLGSLLYTLSAGRPPYRADSPLAVLKKITETTPRPVTEINERVPAWLDRLIGKLMARSIDQRPANADEAAMWLRQSLAHVVNPAQNTLPAMLLRQDRGVISRWRWPLIAAAGCLVAVGTFAATRWTTITPTPRGISRSAAINESVGRPSQPTPDTEPDRWDLRSFDDVADQLAADLQAELTAFPNSPLVTSPRSSLSPANNPPPFPVPFGE